MSCQKSISLLSSEAQEVTCNANSTIPQSVLPGWTVQLTANLVEEKPRGQSMSTPFLRLARRPNAVNSSLTDFLITLRGTHTLYEWATNFAYNLVEQNATILIGFPLHRGFAATATSIYPVLQLQLQEALAQNRLGLITITGESNIDHHYFMFWCSCSTLHY